MRAADICRSTESAEVSLWAARMFPPADSLSESFRVTLELVSCGGGGAGRQEAAAAKGERRYSMADVLSDFDRGEFLRMRNDMRRRAKM